MKAGQKIIITLSVFAAFIALFLGIVVYPIFQGVVRDHKEVLAYKWELIQLREDKESSIEFERLASTYAREFGLMENLFVDSATPIEFFRFLDAAAASFQLQIEKTPGSVQLLREDRWPSFVVRLAGGGLYPDAMAFLEKIENAPYLLEVEKLTMGQRKGFADQQNQGEIEFSMSIKVFTND
ncbi:MAG: hypothetical protein A2940_01750 [Candidatus Wildermuthbacteria bacterium RIFCSPLOWO2_01_FULL_48_29]|uniref:Type 4 fimbrial biogenesis protein PilO n=2 Tax=Candidatus Wildermuthiibacteriota TaxID=1817923 RepID=A0A1G2RLD1_9BACT|nr:MAG: hypothetical protein A2843_01795 [Candidatus Wildermuthbacteria bacterium RIFCSPHIGHO2_01_FULL_48_27b]OHA73663.1 MAG: hypothetical protein A2940_01750 [Candidatus Wildermuthbacteria bacterium RIFCSPLOWO2_01_FULL_48_29]